MGASFGVGLGTRLQMVRLGSREGSCLHASVPVRDRREWTEMLKQRTASRLAWSIGPFSIALMIGALVLMFIDRHISVPATVSSVQWNFANVLTVLVNMGVPTI